MSQRAGEMRQTWDDSFAAQIESGAYNTAAVEAVVRTVAYHLRARVSAADYGALHFLDLGCGAGPNMTWLAEKGITVSGIDISPRALALARETFTRRGLGDRLAELREGSVTALPFADESFDGAVEACVFQHLDRDNRRRAFAEVVRVLKPGGLFVGYMLSDAHSVYRARRASENPKDPGTLVLNASGAHAAKFHLTDIGLSHFFKRDEFEGLLAGCATVEACACGYDLPREEAARRGFDHYHQGMWTLYVVK